jgi:hypothetical protein
MLKVLNDKRENNFVVPSQRYVFYGWKAYIQTKKANLKQIRRKI